MTPARSTYDSGQPIPPIDDAPAHHPPVGDAPVGDAADDDRVELQRPSNRDRPNPIDSGRPTTDAIIIVGGIALVLIVFAAASILGLGTTGVSVVAIAAGLLATLSLNANHQRRLREYQSRLSTLRERSDDWKSKWESLRADTEQTASALAQLTDGVIVLSAEGVILLDNPAARKLLFLDENESYADRLFFEVVRDPTINEVITQAQEHRSLRTERVEVSNGQSVRPLRVSVNAIELSGDSKLLMLIHDETDSHRVEEIRREFVANVSHELKTPLAAIKGYAETVELAIVDDPESASHFMKQILSQCVRLERLVADMMQLARAQAGTHNMTLVQLPLREIVSDALRACDPIAQSKRIDVSVADISDDAVVIADREATLTIANNLISNAVRYTPDGGHVQISTQRMDDYWALVVRDDGVGIPESEHQRVFERFYRVEKTRETTGGGTGIGLSIVKNLTLAQSGEVQLSSRPGEGAIFRVLLPAAVVRADAKSSAPT